MRHGLRRYACIALIHAVAAVLPAVARGFADPAFSRIPFEQWLSQPDQSHIRWTARVIDPVLSPHQRLAARVFVQLDGRELAKRRGKGVLLVLVQVNDETGTAWQNHQEMDLATMEEGIKANDAIFTQTFFVRPGDYRIAIAIYDTATKEYSIAKRKLHVAALRNDPLPDAWGDLPAVEVVPLEKPPDNWYLPTVESRLRLRGETREPAHIDLLVNLTPSERFMGSSRVQNRNMGALLPATKVLSQIDWHNASFGLALLDLARRRVSWKQDDGRPFDWGGASSSLEEVTPGVIDVKSLVNRSQSAQFFLDEVKRRLRTAKKQEVMIVLSSPVEFEPGQDMRPIELNGSLANAGARVYYIRYQPFPPIYFGRANPRSRLPMPDGTTAPQGRYVSPVDQLEPLLKPLEPRLFEVATPEQFRKAVAAILSEIGKI